MRISDWSSDVCSSDLVAHVDDFSAHFLKSGSIALGAREQILPAAVGGVSQAQQAGARAGQHIAKRGAVGIGHGAVTGFDQARLDVLQQRGQRIKGGFFRSEERRGGKACVSRWRSWW